MPEFKKRSFGGGSRRPFDSRPGGGRDFGPKELFEAECNSCHKSCQVPFRPNGKKPVYCSDCFKQEGERPQQRSFDKGNFNSPRSFAPREARTPDPDIKSIKLQLEAMNATLEKLVATLEASNRAAALSKEMRKYVPAAKPATAPAKKPAAKKATKKAAKGAKKA